MRRDNESFDVVEVGGGPAGVTAALRASELGATVAAATGCQLASVFGSER